ncbi:MAG: protein kinase, partial [Myxococcales bacterium]|nr:protein kinase [Myxococcales bacterium]
MKSPNLSCRDCGHTNPEASPGDRCPECSTVLVPKKVLAKYPNDQVLGRVVGGKYAVVSVLGVGGFGAVYRAVQEPVGRHVALKVVHSQHVQDAEMRARFFREARVVARLSDPAVVTLFDYGEEPTVGLYMVFELVTGRNLGQLLEEGPQDPVWTAYILLQVLRALGEAHHMGMVHRDIKPANMMVVDNNRGQQSVRLLDFGIAKVQAAEGGEASLATREGLVLGTPRYMSPEQAKASVDVDARSDLYSLGVVAYALVAGRNPFERGSVVETIMAHVATPPPPLSPELRVPPAFEAVLMRALEKDPADRFQDADEMAAAIVAAFPHVAFPALSYEFRAAPGRLPSILGAAADLASTPTPSAGMGLAAALAEPIGHQTVSPLPPPEVSPTPTASFSPTMQVV